MSNVLRFDCVHESDRASIESLNDLNRHLREDRSALCLFPVIVLMFYDKQRHTIFTDKKLMFLRGNNGTVGTE